MAETFHTLSLSALRAALRHKKISATELAQIFLQRAQAHAKLGAFLAIDPAVTLAQAAVADERLAAGDEAPLLGIPIAHKDIFVTRDFVSTAGSRMLENYRSPFDATVVELLGAKSPGAGMVTLGKLNCDEFAMGSANVNSAYGLVHNPWNPAHTPGGSSGGSAAAVAARLTPVASGTDTGGSIRQPAAFCGITGIKPTYGRVSRYGMIAFASSLDQAGVMAVSAEDCALVLTHLCGPDQTRDATSLAIPAEDFTRTLHEPLSGLRIGLPKPFFGHDLPAAMCLAQNAALQQLVALGAQLCEVDLPHAQHSVAVYYIIAAAEASSNLSRFDGVRYGYRAPQFEGLTDLYVRSRSQGLGPEVQRRILLGTYVLSHGYYDAYYLRAQQLRRCIAQDFLDAFKRCDLIAAPVAPTTAWQLGAHRSDPLQDYLADIFTLPGSLAGLPGLSLPIGFDDHQLPLGLQLLGPHLHETRLLQVAYQYQRVSDWHTRIPPCDAPCDAHSKPHS